MLHIQDAQQNIRTRTKVLRFYLQSMETDLEDMKSVQQTLQIQGLEGLQEAMNDHRKLKDQFENFATAGENLEDSNKILLVLQRKLEEVRDKCTDFMTAIEEAREKQRKKDEEEGGDEEYMVSNEDDEIVTNIPGIKQDLETCLQASKEDDVNSNDLESPVTDWFKKLVVSDEEDWNTVKTMKNKAIQICAEVSRLLTRVMIIVSKSERGVENFRIFRSVLECVAEDPKVKPMVIDKFIYLMKFAEEELKKEKSEEMKVDEAQLEEMFDKFLSEIMRLELVMKDPGVPDAKKLKGSAMEVLKARVESCEKSVGDLKKEVNGLEVVNKFVDESGDVTGSPLVQKMEEEIGDVWTKMEDEPVEVEDNGGRTTSD